MSRLALALGLILSLVFLLAVATMQPATAQETNRAGVVIRYGEGRTENLCVAFEEPDISGYELLQRSGLTIKVKSESQGGLVCGIEGTGCDVDNCLCECKGEPCVYWSYWQEAEEGWTYSTAGATVRRLSDGEVDGWSWGPGSVTSAVAPPAVSFSDICTLDAASAVETEAAPPAPGLDWLPYGLFGLLVAVLGAGTLLVGRMRRES